MNDTTSLAAAVQIAEQVWDEAPTRPGGARAAMLAVVAALARAGLLANPGELAALRTVAELARERTGLLDTDAARPLLAALAKLDALPAVPPGEDAERPGTVWAPPLGEVNAETAEGYRAARALLNGDSTPAETDPT